MSNNLYIRQRSTLPSMTWEIVDESGCPIKLDSVGLGVATSVVFTMVMQDRNMTPVLIDAPAVFADADKTLLEYKWTEYDTLYLGDYYCMFTVYFEKVLVTAVNASVAYQGVTYTSTVASANLNGTDLVFDGIKTIQQVIDDFNAVHNDKITSDAPDTNVVPDAGTVTFANGVTEDIFGRKISYPSQKELLMLTVEKVHSTDANNATPPTTPPTSGEVGDWLNERKRSDYALIGTKDDVNRVFTVSPYFFTVNQAFTIEIFHNSVKLTRGVDFNVASNDLSKLGYNQIIFEEDAGIPSAGDILTANFYISDAE